MDLYLQVLRAYPEMIRTQLAGILSVMLRRLPLQSTKDSCGKPASTDEKSDGASCARLIMGSALKHRRGREAAPVREQLAAGDPC